MVVSEYGSGRVVMSRDVSDAGFGAKQKKLTGIQKMELQLKFPALLNPRHPLDSFSLCS